MLSCTARPLSNAINLRPKSIIYDYATCDSILASATAEVMVYNDAHKQWEPPNGNDGVSVVQIIRSGTTSTFKIIGINKQNKACVLNCNIHHKLKYHMATPTFHQWRDEKRLVYGLSFTDNEEARKFVVTMSDSISYLNDVQSMQNGHNEYHQIHHDNVYQDPHQHMPHNQSAPTFREQEEQNGLHPYFRKSSHSVQGSQQLTQQQRRSSQSSSSSSNTGLSGMMAQMSAPRAPTSVIPSAPAAPPAGGPPPAPPPPPSNLMSGNAPPPPPPPPANLTAPKPAMPGLADELKNGVNKLRKTGGAPNGNGASTPAAPVAPPAPPKMDMVQELALTFSKRKAKQAEANATDNKSNTSNGSSDSGVYPPSKPKSQVNGTTSSPKSHRKAPSASSISSQEENITKTVNGALNGLSLGPVTTDTLEKFRAELMVEVRLEINKAKQEIIEAIRAEMRR